MGSRSLSKLTWGTQTLQRSSKNMVEYKDTNGTIKRIKHANQKQVLPVPHQNCVTFPPVHKQQKSKEDSLHIQHFII